MVNRNVSPTACFWNFTGFALFIFSIGIAISVARTEALELEVARYKLKTGSALNKVSQVTEKLDRSTELLPIDSIKKQEIKQNLVEAESVLIEAENKIDSRIQLLTDEDNN